MRGFGYKLAGGLIAVVSLGLLAGCEVSEQSEISASLVTFAEDLFRQILAAFLV